MTRTQRQIDQQRQSEAVLRLHAADGRPTAGLAVWVEQETHEFRFAGVRPALGMLKGSNQGRYQQRFTEVFNSVEPALAEPRIEVRERVHLAALRLQLDRQAAAGQPFDVHVSGRTVGLAQLSEQQGARRLADLYALCFARPAVAGIVWHGFWDGEAGVEGGGLLRRDLSPRPAFRALLKLLGTIWHSRVAGVSDAMGCFHFRGFRGQYRVGIVSGPGAVAVSSFMLTRSHSAEGPLSIELHV